MSGSQNKALTNTENYVAYFSVSDVATEMALDDFSAVLN